MAARRLLVILIYFTCKTQTKAPDAPPEVSVFPSEISAEADSVTLYCYPPPSIIVSQCYFSIEEGQPIQSSTCRKTLTGTELLAKAGQSSLSEVKVKCFYKVRQGEEELQSSHSNPASIFIQGLPPKLTVHPRVISAETDTVTLYCQPPSSASCFFIIEGKSVASSSCQKTLTVTELLANKGQSSPAVVKVKCFYTVRRGEVYSPSLRSNTLSIQIQTSAPTLTVSAGTISETESVTLRCQTPPSVSAPQCYFYTVKGGSPTLLSCVKTLTGSELLLMSQQSSPAVVEVKCFYTVKLGHVDYPSAHSDAQVMMIQSGPPQLSAHHSPGEHVVFTCYLPGSVIKDTTCNLYFGDGTVQRSILSHRSRMDKKCFCQFYVSTNDLLRLSPQQSHASCDYSLKGDPNTLSPRSEQCNLADILESESARAPTQPSLTQTTSKTSSTVQVQWRTSSPTTSVKDILESKSTMVSTQPSLTETASKTSSPPTTSVRDNNIYKIIACVTCCGGAVGVILLGWLFMKKGRCFYKRTQGNVCIDFIDMEDVDFGGVGTAGKNQSNDALTPEPSAEYCADSKGVDKNIQDNEGEDHFYCAIADVPVKIIQTNMEYGLLQPH